MTHSSERLTFWALLFGNFVVGLGVLMPAGLLNELSHAFGQSAAVTGTLVAYGAAVLCIEAPLLAYLTNTLDRRRLLTAALAVYAVGHLASAFASNFTTLMTARLLMIGGAAVFTPQAASVVSTLVPSERRSTAIAFIFLGWPLASAIGVPLASLMGAYVGWSMAYLIMAFACTIATIAVFLTLPAGLRAPRMSLAAWGHVLSNSKIIWILLVTMLFIAGQFTVYPYIAAILKQRFDASASTISALFAVYGIAGVVGSFLSARAIGRLGTAQTVSLHLLVVLLGLLAWTLSFGVLTIAVAALLAWGYGGGPAISGQQARLIAADANAGSASVALNTSVLYAGQASGTYLGGVMLTHGVEQFSGAVACVLIVAALCVSILIRRHYLV